MASTLQDPEVCNLSWRPAEKADDAFLSRLYASTHGRELTLLPVSDAHLSTLLKMQFEGQQQSYARQYPHSERLVIWRGALAVGQCWLCAAANELRVLDIAILPEQQGCGIGTAILHILIERARNSTATLRLSVQKSNPNALRFYQRLGFKQISEDSVSLEMQCAL